MSNGSNEVDRRHQALTPAAQVIAVPFLDGHIPCVEVNGEPMVIPKPISDLMGLRWAGQYAKITADQTACVQFIYIQVPGDNQVRKHMVISLETFTLWLGGIQPSRVGDDARETVIAYRREAGRRLREHFFGQPKQEREMTKADWIRQALEIEEERERLAVENAELREENEAMLPAVEVYERMIDARGLIPMAVFAQQSAIVRPNGKALGQNTAIDVLREIGILKNAPGTEMHNTPYQEHAHRVVSRSEKRGRAWVNVPYVVPAHAHYVARRIYEHLHPGYQRLPKARTTERQALERRKGIRAI